MKLLMKRHAIRNWVVWYTYTDLLGRSDDEFLDFCYNSQVQSSKINQLGNLELALNEY